MCVCAQAKNKALEEKVTMLTAGSPVTPAHSLPKAAGSSGGGKCKNGDSHVAVLIDTKNVIAEMNVLAYDQCALWWCKVHLESLMDADKPACFPSYKVYSNKVTVVAVAVAAAVAAEHEDEYADDA